jgi:hypothetical protein
MVLFLKKQGRLAKRVVVEPAQGAQYSNHCRSAAFFSPGVGREQVFDGDLGFCDEHRFGMREHFEAVLTVVMP